MSALKYIFNFIKLPVLLGRGVCVLLLAGILGFSQAQATSLWNQSGRNNRSMFADKTAYQRGDIITVVVSESAQQVQSLRLQTDKSAGINNAVGQWLFANSGFGTHNKELPATDISGNNTYTGGGEISNQQTLTGRVSVMVIDVLPNGNLVIEGTRRVSFSGETQYAVLRGLVRKYDIAASNLVESDKIADATIQFISEGKLTESQRKGWLLQINDKVNPF